jgi:hypothetical protein
MVVFVGNCNLPPFPAQGWGVWRCTKSGGTDLHGALMTTVTPVASSELWPIEGDGDDENTVELDGAVLEPWYPVEIIWRVVEFDRQVALLLGHSKGAGEGLLVFFQGTSPFELVNGKEVISSITSLRKFYKVLPDLSLLDN